MLHALKVPGTTLVFRKREKGRKELGERERSSSAGTLFSQTSRPKLGGRQAEQGKIFHPNDLIWQNMLEIFISVGYAYSCGELWSLKDPPASKTDESSVSPWIRRRKKKEEDLSSKGKSGVSLNSFLRIPDYR